MAVTRGYSVSHMNENIYIYCHITSLYLYSDDETNMQALLLLSSSLRTHRILKQISSNAKMANFIN